MATQSIENTLFLGNGFSRTVFKNIPSWSELFEGTDSAIKNYTILYEAFRLDEERCGQEEADIKKELVKKIDMEFSSEQVREDIQHLEHFGRRLSEHHINNIITTNYDNGIEFILCEKCGYCEQKQKGVHPESIYSIRTCKAFAQDETGHRVKLWKIHGDLSRIPSIMLGFDQYCGSLSKMTDYVKANKRSGDGGNKVYCKKPMDEKCRTQEFDHISWIELFFRTNVYIVGFGMDFSELDIWWLLNKRARYMLKVPELKNVITYLHNVRYENEEKKPDIFAALRTFQVVCTPIECGPNYIEHIFEHIGQGCSK